MGRPWWFGRGRVLLWRPPKPPRQIINGQIERLSLSGRENAVVLSLWRVSLHCIRSKAIYAAFCAEFSSEPNSDRRRRTSCWFQQCRVTEERDGRGSELAA